MLSEPLSRTVRVKFGAPGPDRVSGPAEAKSIRMDMDEDAFRTFYEKTSRSLFGYLSRVSGERDLAQDLLQEAYCRLLSTDLSVMDEAQTKSYLFRIATNLLHDHWRRRKSAAALAEVIEAAPPRYGPEAQTDLRSAFGQLKVRERQLLWLAYVEGSSHKEIADSTGLRAGSIRLLLFRARRKLAGVLQNRQPNASGKVKV